CLVYFSARRTDFMILMIIMAMALLINGAIARLISLFSSTSTTHVVWLLGSFVEKLKTEDSRNFV
ncbi:MAG: hypothetical protein WBB82_04685, partial [Limnothrix sp.]